jgi:hypothetical protein
VHDQQDASESPLPNAESPADRIDLDALTELVYQRFVDDLRRERDRAAWLD